MAGGRCVTQLLPGALVGDRGLDVLPYTPPHPTPQVLANSNWPPPWSIPCSCLHREPLSHSLADFSTLPNIPPLLALSALISLLPVAPTPPSSVLTLLAQPGLPFICLNMGFLSREAGIERLTSRGYPRDPECNCSFRRGNRCRG